MRAIEPLRQGGFTLIEAIVALVIMATALTSLYTWVNTGLISLRRAEAVTVSTGVVQEAVQQISLLPLLSQSRGKFSLGQYEVTWQARRVEPGSANRNLFGGIGLYDLSLFDVDFSLFLGSGKLGDWSLRQLRHEKVREIDDE